MLYICLKSLKVIIVSLSYYYVKGQLLLRLKSLTAKTTEPIIPNFLTTLFSWSLEGLKIIKSTDFPLKCYYVIKEEIYDIRILVNDMKIPVTDAL